MEMDTSVTEILSQADKGEEIILQHEECAEEEIVEEIIEIEEIVELEEIVEVEEDAETTKQSIQEANVEEYHLQKSNGVDVHKETNFPSKKKIVYSTSQHPSTSEKKSNVQIRYDASADWEDEEYEQEEQHNMAETIEESTTNTEDFNTYETYNNGVRIEVFDENARGTDSRNHVNYEHSISQENSVDADDSQHEIVQNSENNLVYTVLGSKKQVRTTHDRSNIEFVEVQKYKEENLPDDGTVYYAINDGDGTYVQAVDEDGQQYQFANEETMDQSNPEWEGSNQNQEEQQEQPEQEQIFLHEDEEGQLYFKNEHGQLQPVYLTPEGNYAIAENSSDEQDSQEDANQMHEEQMDTDSYVLPDMDVKQFSSKKKRETVQDDNDDSTVTISLIISEDENGQKRTQVIIPTPAESKCNICNKTFKTSLQLLKHNRLKHAREEDITTRNFPCDLCPKRFTDQNSLARHRKTHTETRPFQCLECHKSFPTATTLRKHLQLHNPAASNPLPCIYCGRRFTDKATLMKHEQSHLAGEKSLVCDICHKCFSNVTDLNIHKKNHEQDRKFDCEVCGREFNRLNNLQRHMMVHQQQEENKEILSCNVCGITYKFSSSLTRHMVTTHMNPEKLRQQAEEQRRKREKNYRRSIENRKTYITQQSKRSPHRRSSRLLDDDQDDDID